MQAVGKISNLGVKSHFFWRLSVSSARVYTFSNQRGFSKQHDYSEKKKNEMIFILYIGYHHILQGYQQKHSSISLAEQGRTLPKTEVQQKNLMKPVSSVPPAWCPSRILVTIIIQLCAVLPQVSCPFTKAAAFEVKKGLQLHPIQGPFSIKKMHLLKQTWRKQSQESKLFLCKTAQGLL